MPIYSTAAQKGYGGPSGLRLFADFLPHIGEFALAFTQLERWITWSYEAISGLSRVEGNEWEAKNQRLAERINSLSTAFTKFDAQLATDLELAKIISEIKKLNDFRNRLFHDSATGISESENEISIMKKRLKPSGAEEFYDISITELKGSVSNALEISVALHAFVMSICPNAENRVP